jgi:hypothetical protein
MSIALLFLATTNAYATQFSFNTSTGEAPGQFDFSFPATMIALASIAGALLIINERRKARGIWFSNSEPLK